MTKVTITAFTGSPVEYVVNHDTNTVFEELLLLALDRKASVTALQKSFGAGGTITCSRMSDGKVFLVDVSESEPVTAPLEKVRHEIGKLCGAPIRKGAV